ncbi:MAG: hypothetical protein ACJ735_00850 [Actinomycetes bacterium]
MNGRWPRLGLRVMPFVLIADLALSGAYVGRQLSVGPDRSRAHSPAAHFRPLPDQSTGAADRARDRAIRDVLLARATAIRRHDRAGFMATLDPASAKFRAQQVRYFANVQHVPFSTWSYTLDADNVAPSDGAQFLRYNAAVWLPHVVLHYEIAGFDRSPTALDTYYTFVQRHRRWYIASDSDAASLAYTTARDIWDFGPVSVVRRRNAIVLGHPDSRVSLAALADEAQRDVPRVTKVWGRRWSQHIVVLAPDRQSELSKLLGDQGDLSQIAAVATAELVEAGQRTTPTGDRVLINPDNYRRLGVKGRQVVVTHEITHVASRASTGPVLPDWLIEGMADYVGYRELHTPPSIAAHELKVYLDQGHRAPGLPGDDDYAGANKHLALAYDESWLACRFIAERWGQAALVRLYRAVGASTQGSEKAATDAAIRGVLHESLATFTRQWQTYVTAVLR